MTAISRVGNAVVDFWQVSSVKADPDYPYERLTKWVVDAMGEKRIVFNKYFSSFSCDWRVQILVWQKYDDQEICEAHLNDYLVKIPDTENPDHYGITVLSEEDFEILFEKK